MVVGLAIAVTAASHRTMMPARKFAPIVTVAHRRSDVIAVSVVITVILVVVVVVVVDGIITIVVMMPRLVVCPVMVRTIPTPTIVETIVVPVGRVVIRTIVIVRPPPVVAHVNA